MVACVCMPYLRSTRTRDRCEYGTCNRNSQSSPESSKGYRQLQCVRLKSTVGAGYDTRRYRYITTWALIRCTYPVHVDVRGSKCQIGSRRNEVTNTRDRTASPHRPPRPTQPRPSHLRDGVPAQLVEIGWLGSMVGYPEMIPHGSVTRSSFLCVHR